MTSGSLRLSKCILTVLTSRISELNCLVIQTQWHFQELRHCVPASEVPDLRLLDLNCGAKLHDEDMPVEATGVPVQEAVMRYGKMSEREREMTVDRRDFC